MRVLLNRRTPRRRDESGAVALLVGVLSVVLVGMAAFTADFGMAYVAKRQSQTAADSAALAAAATFADDPGDCATLADDAALETDAETAAESYLDLNSPDATMRDFAVECVDGDVQVTLSSDVDTPTFFGPVLGSGDTISSTRGAGAAVSVATTGLSGVRPYAVCSDVVPAPADFDGTVVKITQPGQAAAGSSCPASETGGNWWTIDCPEDGSNSQNELANNTRFGCDGLIDIVPGQPEAQDPMNLVQKGLLSAHLITYCAANDTADDPYCLGANSGNINDGPTMDAWRALTTNQEEILLPVFCGDARCIPGTITSNGNTAVFPVHRMVAVTVCGFRWGSNGTRRGQSTTGDCANNPNNYRVTDGGPSNPDNYILVIFRQLLTSSPTTPSDCPVGDPNCDTGLRKVLLTQ